GELRELRGEGGERPRIAQRAVADRVEHFPAVIRRIAVEEVLEHLGDRRAAAMVAIDIVVIDRILGEPARETLAVSRLCRAGERAQQPGEFLPGHGLCPPIFAQSSIARRCCVQREEPAGKSAHALDGNDAAQPRVGDAEGGGRGSGRRLRFQQTEAMRMRGKTGKGMLTAAATAAMLAFSLPLALAASSGGSGTSSGSTGMTGEGSGTPGALNPGPNSSPGLSGSAPDNADPNATTGRGSGSSVPPSQNGVTNYGPGGTAPLPGSPAGTPGNTPGSLGTGGVNSSPAGGNPGSTIGR